MTYIWYRYDKYDIRISECPFKIMTYLIVGLTSNSTLEEQKVKDQMEQDRKNANCMVSNDIHMT